MARTTPGGPGRGVAPRGRSVDRRALGRRGEELAARYLKERGLRVLERNVHVRSAEIDLLALDGTTLCFVEVRLRSSDRFGTPEESLDRRKRARMRQAAARVLAERALPPFRRVRFDLVAIDASHEPPQIRHLRDVIVE